MTLDEGHYYSYFMLRSSVEKVKSVALEKLAKLGEIFLLLCGHRADAWYRQTAGSFSTPMTNSV